MAKTKPQQDQRSTLVSWTDADASLKQIGTISSQIKKQEADMNLKITKIQEQYQPEIDRLNELKIGLERNLQLYCEERREEFNEKKTKELSFGTVSFRYAPPSLKTLKGFTWDAVKNLIKASRKFAGLYLKVKEDLDKNAILSSDMKESELAKLGLTIAQTESFYYESFERK